MTTTRKQRTRLNVSLSPESRAALERFSEASGIAASQFITGMVHDAIPVIDAMAESFRIARSQPERAADLMTAQLLRASSLAAQAKLEFDGSPSTRKPRRRPVKRD